MSPIPVTTLPSPNSPSELASGARGRSSELERGAQVATDFESLFASQILKEMRRTLDSEAMFGGDTGDVYGGMFDLFVGQQMASNGGFGLAKMLREAMQHGQSMTPMETRSKP